jgi:hypothetical protein
MEDPALTPSSNDADPNSQIQPNVEGDGNQVIDQVTGGNVFANVTGNVNIPTIINYYYREEVKILIDDAAESATEDLLPCPYRGLDPFESGDAEYFFGRESFVEELVKATQTRNFIPLLGASGSGKSSVVFAGLVPKLQQSGRWQFTHFRPGSDPFYALAEALVLLYMSEVDSTDKITQAGKLAKSLKEGKILLSKIFRSIQLKHPQNRLLLIADQFEELYTHCTDEATRRNFLDKLLSGIASSADHMPFPPLLVATMRADFLENALSYRPFADVLQNDLKLLPMTPEELKDAIEKPVQKLGVTFEKGLVKSILDDVEGEPGILPLLEFALTELWRRRSGKQLTYVDYEEIGKVQGALGRHADEAIDKISDFHIKSEINKLKGVLGSQTYYDLKKENQQHIRRIFIQLVCPGDGSKHDTRRIATKSELGEPNWLLVQQLADARLVVTNRNDATKQETVEIVHETLIRRWEKLREWINSDRVFRAWQERLRGAMQEWQDTEKDEGSLLRGAALAVAEEHLRKRPKELVYESDFIEYSLQFARWKKLKEKSLYFMFGTLVTLCLFSINKITDSEYILAKIQNKYTFFVTKPESVGDQRKDYYYYDLLRLVLSKAYPGKKIEIKTRKIDGNQGEKTEALNRYEIDFRNLNSQVKIDVDWMMQNTDRNSLASNIDRRFKSEVQHLEVFS